MAHRELLSVLAAGDTDVDARRRAPEVVGIDRRVLDRLPGHFQEQALLGVERLGLPWRDPEELGLEALDVFQEPAELDRSVIPAAVESAFGTRRDRVASVAEQGPERLRIRRAARETTAHPDHGDPPLAAGLRPAGDRLDLGGAGQVVGESSRCWIVEPQRPIERAVEVGLQVRDQLDACQRRHALLEESALRIDKIGAG